MRITSISSGTPVDVEVACTEKSSICTNGKLRMRVSGVCRNARCGDRLDDDASFKVLRRRHAVDADLAFVTESNRVNSAKNRINLTFTVSKPLASGTIILLTFVGVEDLEGFTPHHQ